MSTARISASWTVSTPASSLVTRSASSRPWPAAADPSSALRAAAVRCREAAGGRAGVTPTNESAFDATQNELLVEIGQVLIALSTSGTVAVELTVAQAE